MHRFSRRLGRRSTGFGDDSLYQLAKLFQLANGKPLLTEREYTLVAGTVVDIFDLSDATRVHVVTQADTAKQVAAPAMHADFLRPCYTFTGAEFYTSNRAASTWQYLSDGTGFDAYGTFTPTTSDAAFNVLFATSDTASGQGMIAWWQAAASAAFRFRVKNGAADIIQFAASAGANAPAYVNWSFKDGIATPEALLRFKNTTIASGDSTGAPVVAAPSYTLRLGSKPNAEMFQAHMRLSNLMFFPTLDAAGHAAVRASILALYGVAA